MSKIKGENGFTDITLAYQRELKNIFFLKAIGSNPFIKEKVRSRIRRQMGNDVWRAVLEHYATGPKQLSFLSSHDVKHKAGLAARELVMPLNWYTKLTIKKGLLGRYTVSEDRNVPWN